jgi:hypothetical protein
MAGNPVYDLLVNVSTNIASLQQGMAQASDVVNRTASGMTKAFQQFSDQIESVGNALGTLSRLAGAGLGAQTFVSAISGAIELEAHLGNLATEMGSTVEALSAMRLAAADGGISLDEIATASERLSKSILEGADGTTKAAQAFQLLGVDIKSLSLLDPAQQMQVLAQRLAQFQDGAGKTAVEMEILGRAGAQFGAFLKALATDGTTAALVTTAQAEAARQAEQEFTKLADSATQLKVALANELLPTLNDVAAGLVQLSQGTTASDKAAGLFAADIAAAKGVLSLFLPAEVINAVTNLNTAINGASQATASWGGELNRAKDALPALTAASAAAAKALASLNSVIDSIEGKDLGIGAGFATSFAVLTKAVNDGLISLERYQELTGELLNQQPWATKQAEEAKKLEDEQNRLIDSIQKVVDSFVDQTNALTQDTASALRYQLTIQGVAQKEADWLITERLRAIDVANQLKTTNDAMVKGWQDYDAAMAKLKADQDSYDDSLLQLDKNLQLQLDTLGLSSTAAQEFALNQQLAAAAAADDQVAVQRLTVALQTLAQIDVKQGMIDAAQAAQKAWEQTASAIEEALDSAFSSAFKKGQSAAQAMRDALKNLFDKLVLRPLLQPIAAGIATSLQGITSSLTNSFAFSGNAAGVGGINIGQIIQSGLGQIGGDVAGSISGLFTTGGALGGALGDAAGTLTEFATGATVASDSIAALGATFSAAIPVVGLAIAAIALLAPSIFGKGGGPKTGGSASIGDVSSLTDLGTGNAGVGRFFTPNQADAQLQQTVAGLQTNYNTIIAALGGKGTAGFALGYDTDPQGTADSRVSAGVTIGGRQVFQQQNVDAGRSSDDLSAALSLEAQRAVLAALQASDLPADITKLLNSVDASSATADQIDAVEKLAATYKTINDDISKLSSTIQDKLTAMLDGTADTAEKVLDIATVYNIQNTDLAQAASDAITKANEDAYQSFQDQASALETLIANSDGSTASMDALAKATTDFGNAAVSVIADIIQMRTSIAASFADTEQQIKAAGETPAQQYADYQAQAAALEKQIGEETDPYKLQTEASQLNQLFSKAFGTLTSDQQAQLSAQFVQAIEAANKVVQDQLTKIQGGVTDSAQNPIDDAASKMTDVASKMTDAANTQAAAAAAQLAAAKIPTDVNVHVDVTQSPAEVGNFG